jgi:hypothetical protein
MSHLHPDVARYAEALLRLELHLAANGDGRRATQVSRCRVAAEKSDGWSVDSFLSLFGYMGDFNSAGLPGVTADCATVNRQFSEYIYEAYSLALKLQQEKS